MTSVQQRKAALDVVMAVADAIRTLGRVPSGHLYARVMGHVDIHTYETIVQTLKNARLVEEKNHDLIWIGPKLEDR